MVIYLNLLDCHVKLTVNVVPFLFNREHPLHNNIYQFRGNQCVFARIKAQIDESKQKTYFNNVEKCCKGPNFKIYLP